MKIFKARQMYLLFIVILSVFSITGCGGGGSDGQAPVLGSGDAVIAPRVTLVSPLNNATGVTLNRNITATFSKEMTPATVTAAGTFTVAKVSDGLPIAGTVTYVAAGSTATFNPTSNLAADTLYTATISVAAKDLAGTPLAAPYTWTFRTGLTLDVTAPFLVSTGVADGATDVPINRNSTATFSEPMDPATLASPATNFTVVKTLGAVPVAGTVTYVGNTATFNPTSDLESNTEYTSTIGAGATDLAGNALVAGARANPWSWTTGAGADIIAPTVTLTSPVDLATNVDLNKTVSATFSEEMTNTTITTATFTLAPTAAPASLVSGVVLYDPVTNIATFKPDANLTASTSYTATITSGAQDLAGNALVVPAVGGLPKPNPWTFTTGTGLALGAVNLGSASTFGIMATSAITNTGNSVINGDVSLDPGTSMTGFPPGVVNGAIHINDAESAQARADLLVAYNYAKTLPPGTTINAGEDLGALYPAGSGGIPPGTYTSGSTMSVETPLVLNAGGDADAVWVFQIGSSLTTTTPNGNVTLDGGAQAKNVFWVPTSDATIGVGTTFSGTIVAGRDTTGQTGAVINGRILTGAITAGTIALDTNTVNVPAP